MDRDKILECYKGMDLHDKQNILNIILDNDCKFFLSSEKRKVGFGLRDDAENPYATVNGLLLQINIEIDDCELTAIANEKVSEEIGDDTSKVKLNSFKI
jgi:hypothetical protein